MNQLTVHDIAAIRGCLLNGAKPEMIYTLFEGQYPIEEILDIQEELIKQQLIKE